jgi:hypothetical protein
VIQSGRVLDPASRRVEPVNLLLPGEPIEALGLPFDLESARPCSRAIERNLAKVRASVAAAPLKGRDRIGVRVGLCLLTIRPWPEWRPERDILMRPRATHTGVAVRRHVAGRPPWLIARAKA